MRRMVFVILLMLSYIALGGETGKIAGLIVDKASGDPLIGANVIVESRWENGEEFPLTHPNGGSTDLEGTFFILNLSPGFYNVRASYVGYQEEVRVKVEVIVDKTTTLNFKLGEIIMEAEKIVVTAYAPEAVEKDLTATKQVYNVSEVQAIAGVADISDILELQADVVDDHFRGGRQGESLYLVGGSSIVNPLDNSRAFRPIVTGLDQVEVYTSGFSAEYGNAQSGVVNMVTKEGASSWQTRVEFSSTLPYYKSWGGSVYDKDNLDFYNLLIDTEEWLKENPRNPGRPLWDVGYGVTKYLPPRIVWPPNPLNHQDSLKIAELGKIQWLQSVREVGLQYNNTMDYRVDLATGGPIAKNMRMFLALRQNLENPIVPTPFPDIERQIMANVTYEPSVENKYKFSFIFDNQFENYLNSNWQRWLFDRTLSVTKRSQSTYQYGLEYKHLFSPATFAEFKLKAMNVAQSDRIDLLADGQFLEEYSNGRNWADYTGPSNHRVGRPNDDRGDRNSTSWSFSGSVSSQVDRSNLLKAGAQLFYYNLDVDYEMNVTNASSFRNILFTAKPFEGALFVQDKMEFRGLIANFGMRFDFYDLNFDYFADQFSPLRNPNFDGTRAGGEFYDRNLAEKKRSELVTQLQPRIGISFPVSETSVFHLNYGTFTQRPSFNQVYFNQITINNEIEILGNPRLKPENTKTYDVGLVQGLPGGFQLDVSAYYKDVKDLVETAFYSDTLQTVYQTYVNRDYADIKGFHVNLEKKTGSVRGYIRYNFESATGKSSNADNLDVAPTYFEVSDPQFGNAKLPFPEDVYLDYDRTHKAVFNLRYISPKDAGPEILGFRPFADLSISNTFRYTTGRPFTYDASGQGLKFNQRTPEEREWRIRLEKRIKLHDTKMTAYFEIFNLLNEKFWQYSRTFNDERNVVRWETDRPNILTDNEYAPYNSSQDVYLLRNQPRHYRMGLIFNF